MTLRRERLADQIRDLLASQFQGGNFDDPRLTNVTITAVRLSGDLQLASVYFRVYDEAHQEASAKALERLSGRLRRVLADYLKIRRVPELRFFFDESVERGARIEELIESIKKNPNGGTQA